MNCKNPSVIEICVKASALKGCTVATDGSAVRLDMADRAGAMHRVELSLACLQELTLALPKMMAAALRASYGNRAQRLVYSVRECTVERAVQDNTLILNFTMPDGFAMSFALLQRELLDMADGVSRNNFTDYPDNQAIN